MSDYIQGLQSFIKNSNTQNEVAKGAKGLDKNKINEVAKGAKGAKGLEGGTLATLATSFLAKQNNEFDSWFDKSLSQPTPKTVEDKEKNEAYLIRFDEPYKVHHYNQEQGYAEKIPYTETNHFDHEIARARVFLKNLYVRGVDIEVTAGNDLLFVPLPNKPTQDEIDMAAQLQHGIRYQINNPIDLYEQPSTTFLDDRNTCISCKHLTANKSCRKDGKGHVTWIDRQWLDKKINCTDWTAK